MNLSDRIKLLCNERGITLAYLERQLDVGSGTIRRWNIASPTSDKLNKVANYFGVSVDYLLGRTENRYNKDSFDIDGTYFSLAKEAQESGISANDIRLALDTIKKLRGE